MIKEKIDSTNAWLVKRISSHQVSEKSLLSDGAAAGHTRGYLFQALRLSKDIVRVRSPWQHHQWLWRLADGHELHVEAKQGGR